MTDPRAPRITNTDAARLLSGAGEQLVATLEAVREGHPLEHPAQRTVAQVDDIIERARQSMSREAARLLYMGAVAALELDEDHRVLSPVEEQERIVPWIDLASQAEQLDARARTLGMPARRSWPTEALEPTVVSGHALAWRCVAMAEEIRPGWEWLGLMRGIVLLEQGHWDAACDELRGPADVGFDREVRVAGLRNLCRGLINTGRSSELQHRCERLGDLAGTDPSYFYFGLELAALHGDRDEAQRAADGLRDCWSRGEVGRWSRVLERRQSWVDGRVDSPVLAELRRSVES